MLKACLVDGYGDKPAAGWTMPYSDAAGKAVFRGNPYTGTGFYLQLDNTGSNTYQTVLQGYENMTDVDTGVKPFYSGSLSGYGIITDSNSNATTPRPWILFADDRFFILVIWKTITVTQFNSNMGNRNASDGGYASITLFGDGIPLSSSDAFFSLMFLSHISSLDALCCSGSSGAAASHQYVARNSAGTDADTKCALISGGGPLCLSSSGPFWHTNPPTRVQGQEIVSRPYVNDSAAYTMRCYVPGLWFACHRATEFDQFETLEIGSHRFMVIKCMANSTGQHRQLFLVDVSEEWRP